MDESNKNTAFSYFIGTDVSGATLDHVVMREDAYLFHRQIVNEEEAIRKFIVELKKLKGFTIKEAVFCMEHTGIYCTHMLTVLKKLKANIVLDNPLHIRNSLGYLRGKNDKLDARRIAEYAYLNRERLRLWVERRAEIIRMADLITLRTRLQTLHKALVTPITEQRKFLKNERVDANIRLCSASLLAVSSDIKEIDQALEDLVKNDERLSRYFKIIISVTSVGAITAYHILIATNEFKDIRDPKKFACYAGVAPFRQESGKFRGRAKLSNVANKKVKALLHICAISAYRYDPELKAYFERKTLIEGKNRMSVFNALRYKLILRIFACINQDRMFHGTYQRPGLLQTNEHIIAELN